MTTTFDQGRSARAMRVLLAVHGSETGGWGLEARRILDGWSAPCVRVLAVVNVLRASFTSLLPVAARRYQAACADWQRLEGERLQRLLDDLTPLLPAAADVVWARSTGAELDRAIAEHAAGWSADVILIGAAPAAGPWLGAVHERLIRHAPCPVLVTPVAAPPRRTARVRSLEPARGQRVGLVTGREA